MELLTLVICFPPKMYEGDFTDTLSQAEQTNKVFFSKHIVACCLKFILIESDILFREQSCVVLKGF